MNDSSMLFLMFQFTTAYGTDWIYMEFYGSELLLIVFHCFLRSPIPVNIMNLNLDEFGIAKMYHNTWFI